MIKNLKKIIISEINDFFNKTLDNNIKKLSKKYVGNRVIWFGDPNQMIVISKDNIHGMWGNIYDSEKLESVKKMILNSDDYIEFECSYGIGSVVDIRDIIEHQESHINGHFDTDYDGHDKPYSTDDFELDNYLGVENFDDLNFINYGDIDEDKLEFFKKYKFDLSDNKFTEDELLAEYKKLSPSEDEIDNFNTFIELENKITQAINNNDGDLGNFSLQLRDGHHRVMGAIAAGEQNVCVNLVKEDVIKYKNYINIV